MKAPTILSLAFVTFATLSPAGCDSDREGEAELRVLVNVPAALPLEDEATGRQISIVLEIKAIGLHHSERGWILHEVNTKIDLTDPVSLPRLLSTVRLPYGLYDALRFYDTAAWVIVDGYKYPLDVTGDQGFYVITNFCVDGPYEVEHLELDWDVEGNLHYSTAGLWSLDPKLVVRSAPSCADQCG